MSGSSRNVKAREVFLLLFLGACDATGCRSSSAEEARTNLMSLHRELMISDGECQTTDLLTLGFNSSPFVPTGDPGTTGVAAPRFVYGFCEPYKDWLPGTYKPARMHSADPEVVAFGKYSIERTSSLGDPCERLKARVHPLRFRISRVCPIAFEAFAVGNLDGDTDVEVWSITEEGIPVQLVAD